MTNYAVAVAPAEKSGESAHYRNYQAQKAPWTAPKGMEEVKTVHEYVSLGCKRYAKEPFVGQRKFVKMHTEQREITKKVDGVDKKVKKDWNFYELGPYDWQTFGEFEEFRHTLGAGLVHFGVTPGEKRFHIYAKTCREWMQTAIACTSQSITVVTAYDTLGIEGLRASINQTGTYGILLDKDNIPNLAKTLKDAPSIKLVVYRDSEGPLSDEEAAGIKEFEHYNDGIKVVSFTELVEAGRQNPAPPHPPAADDVCCIMYTSGSTGPPKGVILKHSTVVGGVAGISGNVDNTVVSRGDVFLSILPLAHIFEFTAELGAFYWGAALGYGSPKTISDTNMRNSKGDMRELRPTILIAVPAVFEAIKKGIVAKVSKTSFVTQKVFWGAYRFKSTMRSLHLPAPLVDSLIFKNIKEATGGRLRFMMNGGAPLSKDTRLFINVLIAPLIMGYGLTETNAMCAIANPERVDMDSTGEIVASVTIKLVDVPDAGYFAKNKQGEVWIKGAPVSPGYYENDKETAEAYSGEWFKTGDIGELSPTGTLRIIDRKKNLIKTLNGEYVALERLEALYRSNTYVANICVFADSEHAKPIAVVVPMEQPIKDLAAKLNMEYSESIVHDQKIANAVLKSLNETARDEDLRPVEWLAGITLSDEEWTPQNGFVTSAQKLQRKKIADEYAAGIKEAFKNA